MKYLEPDLLIHGYGPVAEGDGVAETGLPLDRLLGEVHDDLGPLGAWMEEKWTDGQGPANGPTLDGQAPLRLVVTPVGCGWEWAPEGV